jgi:hypothetical protein
MWDISNQYVSEGEVGGLATFICFASMLYLGYKWIGISRGRSAPDRTREWQFWLLGATLFPTALLLWVSATSIKHAFIGMLCWR